MRGLRNGGRIGKINRPTVDAASGLWSVADVQENMLNGSWPGHDPYWSSVSLLIGNDNKADASTSFLDQSPLANTMTAVGNVQYDTAQAPTGMSSSILFDGTGDNLTTPHASQFNFGAADFTIEWMVRYNSFASYNTIYSHGYVVAGGILIQPVQTTGKNSIYIETVEKFLETVDGPSLSTWYHYALVRSGTTLTLYRDGVAVGGYFGTSNVLDVTTILCIGASPANLFSMNGWLACVRVTKGIARYTGAFTPPTLPLPIS